MVWRRPESMCFWDSQDSVAAPIRWRDSGDCSVGFSTWAQVLERGYEGLMAMDPESPLGGRHLEVAEGEAARLSCRGAGLDPREINHSPPAVP